MDKNIEKKLLLALLNDSSDSDDNTEDTSTIEDSPLCSPVQLPQKLLGKPRDIKKSYLFEEPLQAPSECQQGMDVCSQHQALSPLQPMSPETTKLYNILVSSDILDDDKLVRDEPEAPSAEPTDKLVTQHDKALDTQNINTSQFFLLAADTSLEPAPCPDPIDFVSTPSILPKEMVHGKEIIDSEFVPLLINTENCNESSTNSALTPLITPDPLLMLQEVPGESSIEAPTFSPLTPLTNNYANAINKNHLTGSKPPPIISNSDSLLGAREVPGESSIEAPPFSPLTPRMNLPQKQSDVDPLLAASPTFLLENCDSDDSVKDPDYECTEENSNSSIESISLLHNNTSDNIINSHVTGIELEVGNNTDTIADSLLQQEVVNEIVQTDTETKGRPRKGRKRKYDGQTREERKKRKYSNLPYVNSRQKSVDPKKFTDYICICSKKCHEKISMENRLSEFNKFYSLGSYVAQNMFLAACVLEQPVKRSYVSTKITAVSKKKTYSRKYFLKDILVCREMFVKTLQTTPKRINTSLFKKRSQNCITDKRGLQAGHNKITPESEEFFVNVVKKLPRYISHYCRNERNDGFLRPDMTFSKIYDLYSTETEAKGLTPVSFSKAKELFLSKFNLRTKALKKDTCNKCDSFENRKNQATAVEKPLIEQDHAKHLLNAKSLRDKLKSDMELAKNDPEIETITFDLQKTLPLPRIPTNIVFYKRQLWVYNLGIHTGSDDQAHCNVWVEGEAGRGSQEVGSCIIKHATERLKDGVKHLILWSDSCGGQNRNIKLTLMMKALLNDHSTLETITMRFLESGHSFLPNDTDFGKIECALKQQQRIYTPTDYMNIMKTCKKHKPMIVHRMQKSSFLSSVKLEKMIINRKKAVDGSKVSWLKTKEILLKKDAMFSIFMKTGLEGDYLEVDIKKKVRGRQYILKKQDMDLLWPDGKLIPTAKLTDIKSLMHLIPSDAQDFYKQFRADDNVQDDIDGFSGEPDFELELNDDDNLDGDDC